MDGTSTVDTSIVKPEIPVQPLSISVAGEATPGKLYA